MNNQLTQAELIDLAKQAGFRETVWSNILGVNVESIAKFAQLIQQHPVADSRKLVAQALEKSAQLVEKGIENPKISLLQITEWIRALIDQPVDHIEESLGMVEQGETCSGCLGSGEKPYLSDASPDAHEVVGNCEKCGGTGAVEQGGDELVERFLSQDDQGVFVDFYMQCEDSDADGYTASKEDMRRLAELGVVRSIGFGRYEVTSFGDWLFNGIFKQKPPLPLKTVDEFNAEQALANRRGGE